MGGVSEILKSLGSLFVGAYLSFHCTIMNIGELYKIKGACSCESTCEKNIIKIEDINIKHSFCKKCKLFCFTESIFKHVLCCLRD